jgi:hypothetical protein
MKHIIRGPLINTNILSLRYINFNQEYIPLSVDSILNLLLTVSGINKLYLSSNLVIMKKVTQLTRGKRCQIYSSKKIKH